MHQIISDHLSRNGALVLTAAGDADTCHAKNDKGNQHENLQVCPKCKLRKLHPIDGCHACRTIWGIAAECLANQDSQEHRDTLTAMETRPVPVNHSKRYGAKYRAKRRATS